MSGKQKVIIDGDWGGDEMQLSAVLLAHPEKFEVLGATTVFGNASHDQVFENGRDILHLLQHDEIKCYPGARAPGGKEEPPVGDGAHSRDGKGGAELEPSPNPKETKQSVDYILETLRNNPAGSVVITASGPLTNIAEAIRRDPITMKKVKEIVIMGGCTKEMPATDTQMRSGNITHYAEFNFQQAPQDAKTVMESKLPITLLPMNCTHQLTLTEAREKALTKTFAGRDKVRKAVLTMMKAPAELDRMKFGSAPVMHDVHCALYLLHPEQYNLSRGDVFVDVDNRPELKEKNHYGHTDFRPNASSYLLVANSIDDPDKLFGAYKDSLVTCLTPKQRTLQTANAKRPNILVVGSSVMDQIMIADRLGKPGETVPAGDPDYGFGGKGANQAVAARLCGANVSMVSCVGNDDHGRQTIKNYENLGIDAASVHSSPTRATGLAPIFIDEKTRQNQIYVSLGANNEISRAMVDEALAKGPKPDAVIMQCEMPIETVYHTVARAKEQGITSMLNVAPAREVDLAKLGGLNYLVVNENEAERVSGKNVVVHAASDDAGAQQKAKEQMVDNAIAAAKDILDRSTIGNVIVTLGSHGVVLVSRQKTRIAEPFKVSVMDTSGAGDAWLGSFASFLTQGKSEEEAMKYANLFAGLSTQKPGTQKSYPNAEEFAVAAQRYNLGEVTHR